MVGELRRPAAAPSVAVWTPAGAAGHFSAHDRDRANCATTTATTKNDRGAAGGGAMRRQPNPFIRAAEGTLVRLGPPEFL